MGWFTSSSSRNHHHSSSRPGYARSWAGSSYSSSSRHHHSSTSHYKRRPRDGYLQYLWAKLRHLWRELTHYARRHPYKVFFLVVMPLLSGGLLHRVAKQFGVDLPGAPAVRGARSGFDARESSYYYGSEGYGTDRAGGGGMASIKGIADGIGGLASVAKMAQAFM